MLLSEAIRNSGMTPPEHIPTDRWVRFPGIGKGKANRSGWCRMISATLAVFGDWSSDMKATWTDDSRSVDAATIRAANQAHRDAQLIFRRQQKATQDSAASQAQAMLDRATPAIHPYLARKGFPELMGLVLDGNLLIPMRAEAGPQWEMCSVQSITPDGGKRFLFGGRAKGAIHRLGSLAAKRVVLCEGYATGLSIKAALDKLPYTHAVIVCFSASNLVYMAKTFPRAVVCADNDASCTGEQAAIASGLKWTMPYEIGTDFNDLHVNMGIYVVVERMRELFSG